MKLVKTPDTTGLSFSPWELRPGTTVKVDYSYVRDVQYEWNSDESLSVVVSGTVWPTSVKSPWPVEDVVTITPSGLYNIVTVGAINHGPTELDIFYKIDATEYLTSVSAISETASTFYDDWFTDETGAVTPMTVVPLTNLPTNQQVYKPEDFEVEIVQPERGISVLNGDTWTSNSVGTVKMVDNSDEFSMSRNMFRRGKVQVLVPMSCTIEPVIRYEIVDGNRTGKYVEVDLQDWYPERRIVRGILWHRDKLYVMTDIGMYSFDRWSDFSQPESYYPEVTGHDMTYAIDDQLLVTDGQTVKVYKILHDFLHYDRKTEVLRFREPNADFLITE